MVVCITANENTIKMCNPIFYNLYVRMIIIFLRVNFEKLELSENLSYLLHDNGTGEFLKILASAK